MSIDARPASEHPVPAHLAALDDPHAWLEDVEGKDALAWVGERNAHAAEAIESRPGFAATRESIREVLDSPDKIPHVVRRGEWLYNFWTDAEHPRGLWRRTSLESYRTTDPEWQVLIDVDALNAAEGEDWVWHGANVLRPEYRRTLVALSHGGSDADVTRELDLDTLTWVDPADGGFFRPEAKGSLGWIDEDTVFVATDTGPGSLTDSGYPRTVRRWRRGTPLESAELVYEGVATDLAVSASHDHTPGFERDFVARALEFYAAEEYVLRPDGELVRIDVPTSAEIGVHREWLTIELREDWAPVPDGETYPAGSLLATVLEDFLAGDRRVTPLFTPTPTTSLAGGTWTRHHLVITVLDDVKHRPVVLTPPVPAVVGAPWARGELPGVSPMGTIAVGAVDRVDSDEVWLIQTDFLTPSTLSLVDVAAGTEPEPLKSAPAFFDAEGLEITQHFATSADGTRVPYFQVGPTAGSGDSAGSDDPARDADTATSSGPAPTLLYGYGGFEISLTPSYPGGLGRAWLERGGTYVLANIR
ncbi:MAG: S9 family peptidase, partial [Actinomycetales bacterium]|nr:S9 family peptidase [Actinomycetales bacterium]